MFHAETETIRTGETAVSTLSFYFDPICPWTWITAKWLFQVQDHTQLDVQWKFYSLAIDHGSDESMIVPLRMLALARREGGNTGAERLYRAMGKGLHENGGPSHGGFEDTLDSAAREAGFPANFRATATSDRATLRDVEADHREVTQNDGAYGSPWLVAGGSEIGFNGPILTRAPRGQEAVALWERVSWLLTQEYFYEMKRERPSAEPS
jgi:2-hydroxychromene-2-carboxylate isomerase